MDTKLFTAPLTEAELQTAAAIIREGGLLGIPTETVYGLGANGLDENAVAKNDCVVISPFATTETV